MIRVNLLPRVARRKRRIEKRKVLTILLVLVVLFGMAYLYYNLRTQVQSLRAQISQVQAELTRYQVLVKKVDQFKGDRKKLQEKLAAINRLMASRTGPVKVMDEVSKFLPAEVWLTSISQSSSKIVIQGYSFTNFGVADFLTRLNRSSSLFQDVELSYSEKTVVEKVPVERFEITLNTKG